MRRLLGIELMLLTTVVLWALNLTVTRYILTHGFEPLAYATVRYGAAALIFLGIALVPSGRSGSAGATSALSRSRHSASG